MIDTLKASKDLEAAGVERKQAEAHTNAIASIVTDMPTKADFETLRLGIEGLKEAMQAHNASTDNRLSTMNSMMLFHAALTLAILASVLAFAFGLIPTP